MRGEDLIAYLDGECPPETQEAVERGLLSDPAALALFRRLCRQRLMLAQTLKAPAARPGFRIHWQMAVATALFGATLLASWIPRGPASDVVEAARHVPPGTPVEAPAGSTADLRLRDGSEVVLHPLSRAVFQGAAEGVREILELARGTADFRVREGPEPFRLRTPAGICDVRGADFSVELVPDADPTGKPMHSMLVRVAAGQVRIGSRDLWAGEAGAFRADGATADSLKGLKNREAPRKK